MDLRLAAQHHHQIADHCGASFVIQLHHIFLGQILQGHLHHADRPVYDLLPGGDHHFRLLAAKHDLGDFGRIGQVGKPSLVDNHARFSQPLL